MDYLRENDLRKVLTYIYFLHIIYHVVIFLDSSMVEHTAVNRGVVGSSPTRGAYIK